MAIRKTPKKVKDEVRKKIATGEKEADVYSQTGREQLEEDDEIDTWEEGFMEGAAQDGALGKCANCGAALFKGNTVETKIKSKKVWFCSDYCLDEYKEKKNIA
jgi:hypothetical protein